MVDDAAVLVAPFIAAMADGMTRKRKKIVLEGMLACSPLRTALSMTA